MPEVKSRPCFLTPSTLNPNFPLFVFLPGMDGTGQLLRSQTEGLEKAFDVRCLAIPPDDLTTWEDLSGQVVELVRAELKNDRRRRVYLCGESFGGCLAMKVALHSPELFTRIILVNPASAFNQRPFLRWGSQLTYWIPDYFYRISGVALIPFLCALERTAPEDSKALLQAIRSVPSKTVTWRLSLLRDFDVTPAQLRHLTQPVLLLAGGADRLLPSVEEARRLVNYLPNAKVAILPMCGHTCLLETDVHLLDIFKAQNFLESITPREQTESVLTPASE
jgi:pimeloyl-ACP methyl ester carboxylesterase